MGDRTGIEWTNATWNPVSGCDRVSAGCDHCLAPDTPVLYADGSWQPISSVVVGDVLLGFDEAPSLGANRILRRSTVLAVWETAAPTVNIRTRSGRRVTCSEDHRWLCRIRPWFRPAENLTLASRLCAVGDPSSAADLSDPDYQAGYVAGVTAGDGTMRWDPSWGSDHAGYPQVYWRVAMLSDDRPVLDRLVAYLDAAGVTASAVRPFDSGSTARRRPMSKVEHRSRAALAIIARLLIERPALAWKAGWLAGFLDTDGSCDGKNIRWSQKKPNDYLQRVERYAADLGFTAKVEHLGNSPRASTARLYVRNLSERLAFIGAIRPALERKNVTPYIGTLFAADDDPVVSVERGPVRDLVDITTSTGTFIAAGLATHNCYAMSLAVRMKAIGTRGYQRDGNPATSGPGFGVSLHPWALDQPLRWKRPRRIFVNSMSDLFHREIPDAYIARVFAVMALAPQHTFQVLTKRPGRMRSLLRSPRWPELVAGELRGLVDSTKARLPVDVYDAAWAWVTAPETPGDMLEPLPNVWLGVSVENQRWADVRIPLLLSTPAAVRFLSCEPLIAAVTLAPWLLDKADLASGVLVNPLHWVIVGGESGGGARPMLREWADALWEECTAAGVAFNFKQAGVVLAREWGGTGKGDDPAGWPVPYPREFPPVAA